VVERELVVLDGVGQRMGAGVCVAKYVRVVALPSERRARSPRGRAGGGSAEGGRDERDDDQQEAAACIPH
jgi:hypothetical protein